MKLSPASRCGPSRRQIRASLVGAICGQKMLPPHSSNMSDNLHFSRRMICSSLPSVTLCWLLSSRWSVEGGMPSLRANWANVRLPRFFRKNAPSCFSRELRTRAECKIRHSVCGINN
jgi:hypothetical protein